jgi:hypothetical protein
MPPIRASVPDAAAQYSPSLPATCRQAEQDEPGAQYGR